MKELVKLWRECEKETLEKRTYENLGTHKLMFADFVTWLESKDATTLQDDNQISMAEAHKTDVIAMANHKVEYEYRNLLGLIGSWEEVASVRVSKPDIHIITTTPQFGCVTVNGVEYVPNPNHP